MFTECVLTVIDWRIERSEEPEGWPEVRKTENMMNKVSEEVTEPKRESNLTSSRSVAAAGSLLLDWTDFGRLIVTLP